MPPFCRYYDNAAYLLGEFDSYMSPKKNLWKTEIIYLMTEFIVRMVCSMRLMKEMVAPTLMIARIGGGGVRS